MPTIKFKRGIHSAVTGYTSGQIGEPILDLDNNKLYLGQGEGNNPIPLTVDVNDFVIYNDSGNPGEPGFPNGICHPDDLPTGFTPLPGYDHKTSDTYGNYQFSDGSIMVYRPQTWIKVETDNIVDVKPKSYFVDETAANAAGYFCHSIFKDNSLTKKGIFCDKYIASKNAKGTGYIASSIKNGLPISTAADHNPIADLTACSANAYHECLVAPKARDGVDGAVNGSSIFFCIARQLQSYIAICSLAHGQNSYGTTYCAWYDSTYNYPKGCNNDALGDINDSQVKWESDGYLNCGKTGSAGYGGGEGNIFAKSTDNGQNCGIADVNGLMWEVNIGLTCIATTDSIEDISRASNAVITITSHGILTDATDEDPKFIMITGIGGTGWSALDNKIFTATYVDDNNISIDFDSSAIVDAYDVGTNGGTVTSGTFYKKLDTVQYVDFTSGNSLATDHWGATGVAAMMEEFTPEFLTANGFSQRYGTGANQVLSTNLSGNDFKLLQMGFPIQDGVDSTGTNLFGKDYFYENIQNELCVRSCGSWVRVSYAGVWSVYWSRYRASSDYSVGVRCACYPDD